MKDLQFGEKLLAPMGFEIARDVTPESLMRRINRLFTIAPADLTGQVRSVFVTRGGQSFLGPPLHEVNRHEDASGRDDNEDEIALYFARWHMPLTATIALVQIIQGDFSDRQWYLIYETAFPAHFPNASDHMNHGEEFAFSIRFKRRDVEEFCDLDYPPPSENGRR